MAQYREKHNMNAELKWSKVSDAKLGEYIALVDYFFAMNNANHMHFHSVIFDNHKWQHKKFNNGDRDVGLNKLYFQVLHRRFCRDCAPHGDLFICLDRRNSSTPLDDLKGMLNNACARDHKITRNPVKQLVSADSKKETLLQINDVILGAVCAAKNGKHLLATTRHSKRVLAEYVLEKSGLSTYDKDTPKKLNRFSVWNFAPR